MDICCALFRIVYLLLVHYSIAFMLFIQIEKLCNRVTSSTLLSDRRDALRALKSFSKVLANDMLFTLLDTTSYCISLVSTCKLFSKRYCIQPLKAELYFNIKYKPNFCYSKSRELDILFQTFVSFIHCSLMGLGGHLLLYLYLVEHPPLLVVTLDQYPQCMFLL